MVYGAALAAVIAGIGDLDDRHLWTWTPLVSVQGDADVPLLAKMLDGDHLPTDEQGWLLTYDVMHPVIALTESGRVHRDGQSHVLPDDPWLAVGNLLFLIDGIKHSIT